MIRQYSYRVTATYFDNQRNTCRSRGKVRASSEERAANAYRAILKDRAMMQGFKLEDQNIHVIVELW
jgi:hypothetical protein